MPTFPDFETYFNADVAHWQRFLESRRIYQSEINGAFDSITQNASFAFQRQVHLHEKVAVNDAVLEAAVSLGYEIPQPNPSGQYFSRSGRVELSTSDNRILNRLAYLYYLWTVKKITVTSGTRTPREQAEAMNDNWYYHRNQSTHYRNQGAEQEIRHAYDTAIASNLSRNARLDAMTAVIEDQVRHRTYISLHLTGRAVDVRTRDMLGDEKNVFYSLATHVGVRPLDEEDHYHLQFHQ
jgi:hypothetical protein